jgi:putative transposase
VWIHSFEEPLGARHHGSVHSRIIGFGVQAGDVDGIALCRLFNTAISTQSVPHYLSSDNDTLFRYYRWQANLRILNGIEIKSVPYVPLSHPFVERLIGTIRREYLDHALFWNTGDLERKLEEYRHYYNAHRVHTSLGGNTPAEISGESIIRRADLNQPRWKYYCRGLYQLPAAAWSTIRQAQDNYVFCCPIKSAYLALFRLVWR